MPYFIEIFSFNEVKFQMKLLFSVKSLVLFKFSFSEVFSYK